MRGGTYESVCYTIDSESGNSRKTKYIVKKKGQIKKEQNKTQTKDYRLKTQILIGHILDKCKSISPEMFDYIDYKPRSSNSPGRYSPQIANRSNKNHSSFRL